MAYVAGPFDSTHLYVQWGGKLPGNESWSCGVRMAGPAGSAVTDAAAMLAGCATAITAFHTSVNAQISVQAKLSEVKVNALDTGGHYIAGTTNQALLADISGGGVTNPAPANQVALAVSLTTGFSRGPAHRGRFYVPLPTYVLDTTGGFSLVNQNAMKTQLTELITDLNAVNADWKVAVFSRKAGAPAHRLVTGNQVGRILDTQRRRRRSLAEMYV